MRRRTRRPVRRRLATRRRRRADQITDLDVQYEGMQDEALALIRAGGARLKQALARDSVTTLCTLRNSERLELLDAVHDSAGLWDLSNQLMDVVRGIQKAAELGEQANNKMGQSADLEDLMYDVEEDFQEDYARGRPMASIRRRR